ncbi:DUF397 domain-containing protein [Streptomyces sp. NPDC056656]|uniref:DUF397 domain-containing protein n=1 Tax=Streptomyces sp. NPDC056656 TaxID=3345895 RepID=UPI0036BE6E14
MIRAKTSAGDARLLEWFKSSYSSSSEPSDCVEVAATSIAVHVRDSKDTRHPHLSVAPTAWVAFVSSC